MRSSKMRRCSLMRRLGVGLNLAMMSESCRVFLMDCLTRVLAHLLHRGATSSWLILQLNLMNSKATETTQQTTFLSRHARDAECDATLGASTIATRRSPVHARKAGAGKASQKCISGLGWNPGPKNLLSLFGRGGSLIDVRQSCLKLKEKTNAWRDLVLRTLHRRSPLDLILTALGPNKQYS